MRRHFTCSPENLRHRRYHTVVTSGAEGHRNRYRLKRWTMIPHRCDDCPSCSLFAFGCDTLSLQHDCPVDHRYGHSSRPLASALDYFLPQSPVVLIGKHLQTSSQCGGYPGQGEVLSPVSQRCGRFFAGQRGLASPEGHFHSQPGTFLVFLLILTNYYSFIVVLWINIGYPIRCFAVFINGRCVCRALVER